MPAEVSKPSLVESCNRSHARAEFALLLAILGLAAALRLIDLNHVPPGLNQDEAINGWNAWCLLKTGRDQAGVKWPIFYTHALGENRTTLYLYAVLPFEALGGLSVWTNRLPSAVGGVLTVLLTYWVGKRLFSGTTGLLAAVLLAVSPWHIQLSRFGHEAALGPLVVVATLAAWLWAGLPLADEDRTPHAGRCVLAGLLTGVACYGYPAVRLFVPIFLVACVAATWRAWWGLLKTRHGKTAIAALVVSIGATFGPLAYYHLAHAGEIAKRAEGLWLWSPTDSLLTRVLLVGSRYFAHFGTDFLFSGGDRNEMQSAAGFGMFSWYVLPLTLFGLVVALRRVVASRAVRVALCWLAAYPAGDCLNHHVVFAGPGGAMHMSLHMLRSAPGLAAITLLAAIGLAVAAAAAWRRQRVAAAIGVTILALGAGGLDARFLRYYFGKHNLREPVYFSFHEDLVQACAWLRPRLPDTDAVFVTTRGMNMPYITMLVVLGYDPHQWFRDEREVHTVNGWDFCSRVGKLQFLYPDVDLRARLAQLKQKGASRRVLLVVRPGETSLQNPAFVVRGPRDEPVLLIFSRDD